MSEVHFKKFDKPRRKESHPFHIDEVRGVLENAKKLSPHILYPYLACVAHTGARRSEVTRLDRKLDIDFATGLIHLRETKNSHERFVRISPTLGTVLKDHLESHCHEPLIINAESTRIHRSQILRLMNKFKAFFPVGEQRLGLS